MFEAGGPENAGSFSFASMKPHQIHERALWNSAEITEVTLSPSRGASSSPPDLTSSRETQVEFSGRPELKLCHIWVERVNVFLFLFLGLSHWMFVINLLWFSISNNL